MGLRNDGRMIFTDFAPELNFCGIQHGVCHDQWRGLECRKPSCDRKHSFTHPKIDAM